MVDIAYEIVPHDNGWAYKLGETLSEVYPTPELAMDSARSAAERQKVGEGDVKIIYPTPDGGWQSQSVRTDSSGTS